MKLGMIGLPGSGKSTLFEALTRGQPQPVRKGLAAIATVRVPDARVDFLSRLYQPRKTTYAQVEYLMPEPDPSVAAEKREEGRWNQVRNCDSLLQVVRNFNGNGHGGPRPEQDFARLNREMVFSDFMLVEKRIERLQADRKRGKKINEPELSLLRDCLGRLEQDTPLRRAPELKSHPRLKGYGLISAKPLLVLFNQAEELEGGPLPGALAGQEDCLSLQGKLEQELARMSPAEAREFQTEFGISESALDRVIRRSYELLGLISFFTVGEDEVRAWTIRQGTPAADAAAVIHSDLKQGFIRAEVCANADLVAAGNFQEAKKRGRVRLEGKTYLVQDGDIINFRFNV